MVLDWLTAHREMANTLINFAMLLVWVVYLHVFVSSYRRQKRANILITIGAGMGLEARCLVSNLSQSPIYVRSIVIEARTGAGAVRSSVTEIEEMEHWERPSDLNLWTRQGPLQPGALRDMGTFGAMLDHASRKSAQGARSIRIEEVQAFDLSIICNYGPEDLLVAAEQTYSIDRSSEVLRLRPQSIAPKQVRSRRARVRIKRRLERDL